MKRSVVAAALLAFTCVASSHSESTRDSGYPRKLTAGSRLVGEGLARFTNADSILDTSARPSFEFRVDAVAHEIRAGVWRYEYQVTPVSGGQLETFALDTPAEARLAAPKGWSTASSWESRSNVAVWSASTNAKRSGKLRFSLESPQPPGPIACYGEPVGASPREEEDDQPHPPTLFDTGSTGLTLGPSRASESRSAGQKRLSVVATPPPGRAMAAYQIVRPGEIQLIVADSTGQTTAVLADRSAKPGMWAAIWNGLDQDHHVAPSGQYSFRLRFNGREVASAPILVPR